MVSPLRAMIGVAFGAFIASPTHGPQLYGILRMPALTMTAELCTPESQRFCQDQNSACLKTAGSARVHCCVELNECLSQRACGSPYMCYHM